jgi:FkbM family methyltransferase
MDFPEAEAVRAVQTRISPADGRQSWRGIGATSCYRATVDVRSVNWLDGHAESAHMNPFKWIKRRRELTYRILNTILLRFLHGLYHWYGLKGTFHINCERVLYEVEGIKLEFCFREFGCTGNADANGMGENETRYELFRLIPPHGVVYDLGAHEGAYTLTCGIHRPDVTVYSFEPLAERLKRHLSLNGMSSERVEEVAVGGSEGVVRMVATQRSRNHVAVGVEGTCEVRIVQLDQYTAERNMKPPDFIKIDIEGMESFALRGAERLLRDHQPIIICEINESHQRYGVSLTDFIEFMDGLQYEIYRQWAGTITKVELPDMKRVCLTDLGRSAYDNYWFIPQGRLITESVTVRAS